MPRKRHRSTPPFWNENLAEPRRVGDAGAKADDASAVAAAFEQAAARAAAAAAAGATATPPPGAQGEDAPPSAIIVKRRSGGSNTGEGDDSGSEALMQLLPPSCRQGVLCRVPSPPGGGGSDARDMVVLLGSTLAGSGVFSGMDGAWFERVCACLALGPAGTPATATAEAGGR